MSVSRGLSNAIKSSAILIQLCQKRKSRNFPEPSSTVGSRVETLKHYFIQCLTFTNKIFKSSFHPMKITV
ncbi:hypothetical protein HOLDEFILI_04006 [Holdemania filiformis DSM 12042]|uniref:Uncharacterized protein n=1 Tax=Holdemania filiformis DSM 12042 TaxID=545696 RepID=B9YDT2_9FIRM|nr:hypothetical protein HOLDEFILI_04006 [Holdemania filiformis DSM 12042]